MPEKAHKKGFRGPSPDVGKETQFKPGHKSPGPGRPKTKILRDIARKFAEEKDPETQKQRARQLVESLFFHAAKGSLGHYEEFLKLLEEDYGSDIRLAGPGSVPLTGAVDELSTEQLEALIGRKLKAVPKK